MMADAVKQGCTRRTGPPGRHAGLPFVTAGWTLAKNPASCITMNRPFKRHPALFVTAATFLLMSTTIVSARPTTRNRAEIPAEYKWDVSSIYQDWTAWEEGMKALDARIAEFAALKGTLARGAQAVLHAYRLNDDIDSRRRAVLEYRKALDGVDGIGIPWTDEAVRNGSHFAFAIVLPDRETRDRFRTAMADSGIQTTWYPALPTLTAYQQAGHGFDRAVEVGYRHCALPLSSGMPIGETREVAERVKDVVTSLL